jgi:4-alpha-glucanotransferase
LSYRLFYFEKYDGGFRRGDEYPQQALVSSTTHDLPTLTGYWAGADIEARREAGTIDEEGYRAQSSARAQDKQKMLDVLFQASLLPEHLPRAAGDYPELTEELLRAIAGFLAVTPSQLWAINQEDITRELHQQNLPGTTWQYPNWRRKLRFTIEELQSDPQARALSEIFHDWIVKSSRANAV